MRITRRPDLTTTYSCRLSITVITFLSVSVEYDLAQFGIPVVTNKDIEADLAKLMGEINHNGDSSIHSILGSGAHVDDEDEAEIMRTIYEMEIGGVHDSAVALGLSSCDSIMSIRFDEDGDDDSVDVDEQDLNDPHLQAELNRILMMDQKKPTKTAIDITRTQKEEEGEEVAVATVVLEHVIDAEKVKALQYKREGRMTEALETMRHIRQLEAQRVTLPSATSSSMMETHTPAVVPTSASSPPAAANSAEVAAVSVSSCDMVVIDGSVSHLQDDMYDDNEEIDVTEEDMENPEFLAILDGSALPTSTLITSSSSTTTTLKTTTRTTTTTTTTSSAVQSTSDVIPSQEELSRDASSSSLFVSLDEQILAQKKLAVQLKREDRIDEALAVLGHIKRLEAEQKDKINAGVAATSSANVAMEKVPTGNIT